MSAAAERLLEVRDLSVRFSTPDGPLQAVDRLSFDLDRGETLGIVGESGSGKTVACLALLGLLPDGAEVSGSARLGDDDLLALRGRALRRVRGRRVAMVFQDPFSCLHPLLRVGDQLAEAVRAHERASRREAHERAIEALAAVGVPSPRERARDYPHQWSGGMRQRAMIAMALLHRPDVLLADEPTTALDVTVQAQILELFEQVKREFSIGIVLVTHDLGVVAEAAQRVLVLYAGRAAEQGTAEQVLGAPRHPYTWGLLGALPREDGGGRLQAIEGAPPSLVGLPPGCAFAPRCAHRLDACVERTPALDDAPDGHAAACHLPEGVRAAARAARLPGALA
ncbi:MAG: ABC transporter ATP-binding protein [Thermoleophilia bacterium]